MKDIYGDKELHLAVMAGDKEKVEMLLKNGADIEAKNNQREWTALYFAASENHVEIVEILLKNGANVDAKDSVDRTALHYAALRGDRDMIKLLIEHRADINSKDFYYKTPIDFTEDKELIEFMREEYNKVTLEDK